MRTASCIFAALLSLPSLAQTAKPAQLQPSALTVRLTDQLGAMIGKALVLLHSDALERENPKPFNMELRTNSEGEAKGELPSGFTISSLRRPDSPLAAKSSGYVTGRQFQSKSL